jgi:hypothetical protein
MFEALAVMDQCPAEWCSRDTRSPPHCGVGRPRKNVTGPTDLQNPSCHDRPTNGRIWVFSNRFFINSSDRPYRDRTRVDKCWRALKVSITTALTVSMFADETVRRWWLGGIVVFEVSVWSLVI